MAVVIELAILNNLVICILFSVIRHLNEAQKDRLARQQLHVPLVVGFDGLSFP